MIIVPAWKWNLAWHSRSSLRGRIAQAYHAPPLPVFRPLPASESKEWPKANRSRCDNSRFERNSCMVHLSITRFWERWLDFFYENFGAKDLLLLCRSNVNIIYLWSLVYFAKEDWYSRHFLSVLNRRFEQLRSFIILWKKFWCIRYFMYFVKEVIIF